MNAPELPEGWNVYERETPEGVHWTAEHFGPHGVTCRLGDATREGLVAKVIARDEYRKQAGVPDPSPISLRTTP
jgi:hypothetical protein